MTPFNPSVAVVTLIGISSCAHEWSLNCLVSGMVAKCLLILAGLFVVGLVGAFVLYVSVVSIVTAVAIAIGVLATLALGYWAGCCSTQQPPQASP